MVKRSTCSHPASITLDLLLRQPRFPRGPRLSPGEEWFPQTRPSKSYESRYFPVLYSIPIAVSLATSRSLLRHSPRDSAPKRRNFFSHTQRFLLPALTASRTATVLNCGTCDFRQTTQAWRTLSCAWISIAAFRLGSKNCATLPQRLPDFHIQAPACAERSLLFLGGMAERQMCSDVQHHKNSNNRKRERPAVLDQEIQRCVTIYDCENPFRAVTQTPPEQHRRYKSPQRDLENALRQHEWLEWQRRRKYRRNKNAQKPVLLHPVFDLYGFSARVTMEKCFAPFFRQQVQPNAAGKRTDGGHPGVIRHPLRIHEGKLDY